MLRAMRQATSTGRAITFRKHSVDVASHHLGDHIRLEIHRRVLVETSKRGPIQGFRNQGHLESDDRAVVSSENASHGERHAIDRDRSSIHEVDRDLGGAADSNPPVLRSLDLQDPPDAIHVALHEMTPEGRLECRRRLKIDLGPCPEPPERGHLQGPMDDVESHHRPRGIDDGEAATGHADRRAEIRSERPWLEIDGETHPFHGLRDALHPPDSLYKSCEHAEKPIRCEPANAGTPRILARIDHSLDRQASEEPIDCPVRGD